jgi:hypothetical protein
LSGRRAPPGSLRPPGPVRPPGAAGAARRPAGHDMVVRMLLPQRQQPHDHVVSPGPRARPRPRARSRPHHQQQPSMPARRPRRRDPDVHPGCAHRSGRGAHRQAGRRDDRRRSAQAAVRGRDLRRERPEPDPGSPAMHATRRLRGDRRHGHGEPRVMNTQDMPHAGLPCARFALFRYSNRNETPVQLQCVAT